MGKAKAALITVAGLGAAGVIGFGFLHQNKQIADLKEGLGGQTERANILGADLMQAENTIAELEKNFKEQNHSLGHTIEVNNQRAEKLEKLEKLSVSWNDIVIDPYGVLSVEEIPSDQMVALIKGNLQPADGTEASVPMESLRFNFNPSSDENMLNWTASSEAEENRTEWADDGVDKWRFEPAVIELELRR